MWHKGKIVFKGRQERKYLGHEAKREGNVTLDKLVTYDQVVKFNQAKKPDLVCIS